MERKRSMKRSIGTGIQKRVETRMNQSTIGSLTIAMSRNGITRGREPLAHHQARTQRRRGINRGRRREAQRIENTVYEDRSPVSAGD